jgi:uncharacterized Zn-finger protein
MLECLYVCIATFSTQSTLSYAQRHAQTYIDHLVSSSSSDTPCLCLQHLCACRRLRSLCAVYCPNIRTSHDWPLHRATLFVCLRVKSGCLGTCPVKAEHKHYDRGAGWCCCKCSICAGNLPCLTAVHYDFVDRIRKNAGSDQIGMSIATCECYDG